MGTLIGVPGQLNSISPSCEFLDVYGAVSGHEATHTTTIPPGCGGSLSWLPDSNFLSPGFSWARSIIHRNKKTEQRRISALRWMKGKDVYENKRKAKQQRKINNNNNALVELIILFLIIKFSPDEAL